MPIAKFDTLSTEYLQGNYIAWVEYPVKGSYAYLEPVAYLYERLRRFIYDLHLRYGHEPILFPSLIPISLFRKEKEFFKGFSPEAYLVEKTLQGKQFEDPLVLRPTSEVPIYHIFSKIIRSYRQLPKKVFQVVTAYRCETKQTTIFLRHREIFGFVEAHTFLESKEDANRQMGEALNLYREILDTLLIPYVEIEIPKEELFPGAEYQYDMITFIEKEGIPKVLELASIINLGQRFSKPFGIVFKDKEEKTQYVWQVTYGIGIDRIIGAALSLFRDETGYILPPVMLSGRLLPKIPIIPVNNAKEEIEFAREIARELSALGNIVVDDRGQYTYGEKLYYWEKRWGVPIRVEIGPKEIKEGFITIATRKSLNIGKVEADKDFVKVIEELAARVTEVLKERVWKEVKLELKNSDGELLGTIIGGNIDLDQFIGQNLYGRKF